jgi:putative ABC transport system permease protein
MYAITLVDIAVAFIPVLVTLVIIFYWSSSLRNASFAILRMLIQLLLIGYALEFIFNANNPWIILAVLSFMLAAASWIALGALPVERSTLLVYSLLAIAGGGIINLVLITQAVLHVNPWYQPAVMIPLAGMIFSNSMNSVSLAGERLYSELSHHNDARDDDRPDPGRHFAPDCRALPDHRHVHDFQLCRNIDRHLPVVDSWPQHAAGRE